MCVNPGVWMSSVLWNSYLCYKLFFSVLIPTVYGHLSTYWRFAKLNKPPPALLSSPSNVLEINIWWHVNQCYSPLQTGMASQRKPLEYQRRKLTKILHIKIVYPSRQLHSGKTQRIDATSGLKRSHSFGGNCARAVNVRLTAVKLAAHSDLLRN